MADKTGVTQSIKEEAYKFAGKEMQMYAHWFTGGTFVDGHKYDMSNVLYEYPEWCLNKGWPHLYGDQSMRLRELLWQLSDQKRSLIVEEYEKQITASGQK